MSRKPLMNCTDMVKGFQDQLVFQKTCGLDTIFANLDGVIAISTGFEEQLIDELLKSVCDLENVDNLTNSFIFSDEQQLKMLGVKSDEPCMDSYKTLAKAVVFDLQNSPDFDYDLFVENQKQIKQYLINKKEGITDISNVSATSKSHGCPTSPDQKQGITRLRD